MQDEPRKSIDLNIPNSAEERAVTQEPREEILRFFEYRHLPVYLQSVSKAFHRLAHDITEPVIGLPRSAERTVALRKLLEAKDAAVRAAT